MVLMEKELYLMEKRKKQKKQLRKQNLLQSGILFLMKMENLME
nr:MAG TPA: hypothetical protein [Caudoviricetes sp.]